jgi:hypothetical protein
MKKPVRIRIMKVSCGPYRGSAYRGIVMHGTKMVASTSNISVRAVCECLTEALSTDFRVSQRAVSL